jgi:hypothetical protein
MFPPRTYRTAVEALLEVADALLRPPGDIELDVDLDDHPHRSAARIERTRRPGSVPAPAARCLAADAARRRSEHAPHAPARL